MPPQELKEEYNWKLLFHLRLAFLVQRNGNKGLLLPLRVRVSQQRNEEGVRKINTNTAHSQELL